MKIVRFKPPGESPLFGILEGDRLRVSGEETRYFKLEDVKILPPVQPSKVVCVGLNYKEHAQEMGMELPKEPVIFLKPSTSVIGHMDPIKYPKDMVKRLDYEGELGVVIRERAYRLKRGEEKSYIMGYTCVNDVTARDLQERDGQWTRAKSFDTFCPIGPWIETSLDPTSLKIETLLNGKVVQSSNTSDLIFDPFYLVWFISQIMTLLPGDVISTGTPPGVGPMDVGDVVEVRIEGIGSLVNRVERL